jgi:poly-gamma-glutamate synthesis protein (capsule biosynthesis protein)
VIVATLALACGTAPAAAATVDATRSAPPTISVVAVGDLLFDGAPGRLVRSKGPNAPFSAVRSVLHDADLTVGNLECPLSTRGSPVPGKTYTFRGSPRSADGLKWAGFDVVSLANNHARDYGGAALLDTIRALRDQGIEPAGAGKDRAAAWKPAIVTRGGARIAFLGFSEITPTNFAATTHRSGTAYTGDINAVKRAIKAAHKKADYVVVSFHWGVERSYACSARQVRDGRAAIGAGADLVLSHHPHVIQGVEFYKKGLIAYSLGNFVFSPGSVQCRDTMVLRLQLGPKGVTAVSARPVWIGYDGMPRFQRGSTARRILGVVARTSRARGTHVKMSSDAARLTR